MAEIIPNQPIILDEDLDCHLDVSNVKMLAQYGDVNQLQMKLEPTPNDYELIQNSEFNGSTNWSTTGGGWTIGGGTATHVEGVAGSFYQAAPTPDGTITRLTFDVNSSSDTIPVVVTWGNYVGNFFTGSHEVWIEASSANNLAFSANGSLVAIISNLQFITVNTNFAVSIVDNSGNIVDSLNTSDGYFNFTDGFFTVGIDWEALSIADGCYQLYVVDPEHCSQRGIIATDFETSTFAWQISGGWTISGGTATFNDSALATATLYSVLCSGLTYEVTYTLSNMGANEEFSIACGSVQGTTRTADGTYTDTIVSNGTLLRMRGNSTSGTQTFDVTNLEIEEVIPSTIYFSNFIKVQETFSCRTMLIYMCNDSDAFGFGFENTGFAPSYRIEGSLARGSWQGTRNAYEYSTGRKSVTYAEHRVVKELGLDLPVHLVEFMYLSVGIDHFYVGAEEFFVEDDEFPTVAWDEVFHEGGFTLNISKKVQELRNRRLTSASVGCTFGGNVLLDENGVETTDELGGEILDG